MEKIRDRMPAILDKKQFDEWLDPEVHESDQVGALPEVSVLEILRHRLLLPAP